MKKIAVIEKVAKIIEIVAGNEGDCTLTNISRTLNMQPSTTHNLLQNLIQIGYLEKNENLKKYKIGARLLEIISPASKRKLIINASESVIRKLAETVKESVVLAIFHNNERYVIATAEYSGHLININLNLFKKSTCYETVTGRVLLAYLSEKELKHYVKNHGYPCQKWDNIKSFAAFKKAINQIRNKQIAIKKSKDVAAVAVPVFGTDNKVWAALGIYMPATRFTSSRRIQLITELKKAANQISENIMQGAMFEKTD